MTAHVIPLIPAEPEADPPLRLMADLDSEGSVLGSLLNDHDGANWAAVSPLLRPEMFFAHANQRVYEAIAALHDAKKPTDAVSVAGVMRKRNTLHNSGGTAYVATILGLTQPTTAHPQVFAAEVAELWRQRALVACMERVAALMLTGELSHDAARLELREHFRSCK